MALIVGGTRVAIEGPFDNPTKTPKYPNDGVGDFLIEIKDDQVHGFQFHNEVHRRVGT